MLLLLTASLFAVGCGSSRSAYSRTDASPSELVWAYDDGLEVVSGDNQPLAAEPRWGGLSEAVDCVPAARKKADAAELDALVGTILRWTGWIGIGAGIGLGIFVISAGLVLALTGNLVPLILAGLLTGMIGIGTTAAGSTTLLVGAHFLDSALPEAIDAVNIFNDEFETTPGCQVTPAPGAMETSGAHT